MHRPYQMAPIDANFGEKSPQLMRGGKRLRRCTRSGSPCQACLAPRSPDQSAGWAGLGPQARFVRRLSLCPPAVFGPRLCGGVTSAVPFWRGTGGCGDLSTGRGTGGIPEGASVRGPTSRTRRRGTQREGLDATWPCRVMLVVLGRQTSGQLGLWAAGKAAARTVRTGHGALRRTLSATLPTRRRAKPVVP
jgi:hypothetical protein